MSFPGLWKARMATITSFSNALKNTTKLGEILLPHTAQKMKFYIKDFFSKYDQIRSVLRIWSHLLKKSLMKNFIFCAVTERT